ncbi:MAG: RnfH family protein [Gammaproteobacteria bacterium HGW-Gammaproteobacteria-10]|nr:MAG: RnfH family protein [Gammaproteobacteria bacterium HGW-Gammaproteobacteria-10]
MAEKLIRVEVAYAKPEEQVILNTTLPEGATVEDAIIKSGILVRFPEIDLSQAKVGIFSGACKLNHVLKEFDRVEIYRPLLHDPKESRRSKAAKE